MKLRIGFTKRLCGDWHIARVVNCFGWAVYFGPVYVMAIES